jgi:hypothetical protein
MARKPGSTQPYLNHDTLDQKQQARHLGVKEETVCNLGHPVPVSRLTENPAGRMVDYANNDVSKGIVRGPARSVGVYGSFKNPTSGISSEQNLSRWSGYASANTEVTRGQAHGPGPGKDPPMSDDSRMPAAGKDSDGYLQSTRNWPNHEYGADSGPGRLEKTHRK